MWYFPQGFSPEDQSKTSPGTDSPKRQSYAIAVIPGDGIGPEVVAQGQRILQQVMKLDPSVHLTFEEFPWNSQYYFTHGTMMPPDGLETLRKFDAIYFGAIGVPDLPLHIPVWGLILPIRQAFDQYVNLRPVFLYPGIKSPLDSVSPGDINMWIVRENSEGEYAGQGARLFAGTPRDVALQTAVYSRHGVQRTIRYAFELARHFQKRCMSISKGNALNYSGVLWDDVFHAVAQEYPDVAHEALLVDAAALYMVTQPERSQVVVTANLFGDILSDLGAAIAGGLGLAASANFNPDRQFPALFEPVHGSAPDKAGQGIANPLAAIVSGGMMMGYLGHSDWEWRIITAVQRLLRTPGPRTPDLGGTASTEEMGDAVLAQLTASMRTE